jgi:hypothetical protein
MLMLYRECGTRARSRRNARFDLASTSKSHSLTSTPTLKALTFGGARKDKAASPGPSSCSRCLSVLLHPTHAYPVAGTASPSSQALASPLFRPWSLAESDCRTREKRVGMADQPFSAESGAEACLGSVDEMLMGDGWKDDDEHEPGPGTMLQRFESSPQLPFSAYGPTAN